MSATRESFDVLFDNIVSTLESYATAQAAVDTALGFTVRADNMRQLGEVDEVAWVLPRIDRTTFESETSAVGQEFGLNCYYAIDCVVRAGKSSTTAGQAAFSRLRYLVTQVIRALWNRDDWDLSMADKIYREMPDVQWIQPEVTNGERAIIGATVTLGAGLSWQLAEPTGTDLVKIDVDLDQWSLLYEYGE